MSRLERAAPRPWSAVVFDLDGTLADTLRDLAEATNAALRESGLPPRPLEAYPHMVGNGLAKLIERAAGPDVPQAERERIRQDFLRIYGRDCLRYTRPYEGMPEALAALRGAGIPLLVVTNKPDAQAHTIVRGLFGRGAFAGIYGNGEGRKVKPDPALTLEALASVGARPENSLFIGDSDVDVYTAANAGMRSAGAVWGFRGEEELREAGADFLLHKPAEILDTYEFL